MNTMIDLNFINQRKNQGNNSTIGDIYQKLPTGEWKWFSYLVEDDGFGEKGDKRMPAGKYELKIHDELTKLTIAHRESLKPWFEYHIEVTGIVGHSGVYFHPGNDQFDTLGCQTPNDQMGNNNLLKSKIGSLSRQATERFYALLYPHLKNGGKAFYEIRDEDKLWIK